MYQFIYLILFLNYRNLIYFVYNLPLLSTLYSILGIKYQMRHNPSAVNLSDPLLEGGKKEAGKKERLQMSLADSKILDKPRKSLNTDPVTPAECYELPSSYDQKEIQFKELLEQHRKRTEYNMPHTIMQVEDVMFVREDRIIALEYIYYNKQSKYQRILQKKPQNYKSNAPISEKFSQEDNESDIFKSQPTRLGDAPGQNGHEPNDRDVMDSYQPEPVELLPDLKEDYIKMHTDADWKKTSYLSGNRQSEYFDKLSKIKFIKLIGEAKEEVALLEPLISIWKISKEGNLSKIKEESFNMRQNFTPSNGKQMMFSLSFDQKIVSLTLFNEKRELGIVAWEVDKYDAFERIKIDKNLAKALKEQALGPREELVQLKYLQGGKYLQLVCKKEIESAAFSESSKKPRELVYTLFRNDGHIVFQFRTKSDGSFGPLHCLAMLPKHVDCEDEEQNFEVYLSSDEDKSANCNINQQEELDEDSKILSKNDLSILFLFVDTSNTDKLKQNFQVFKIEFYFKTLMSQFKQNHLQSFFSQELKLREVNNQDLPGMNLPIRWFRQEGKFHSHKDFHDKISVGTTHNCYSFGFLNHKEQLYLAFQRTVKKNGKVVFDKIGTQHIPKKSIPSIVRNQSTKPFLCLIVRIKDDGSTAFCFHSKDYKNQIKMKDDHVYASQDIILQTYRLHETDEPKDPDEETESVVSPKKKKPAFGHGCQHFNYCRLQSCSISQGDQSVLLKTGGILDKWGEEQISLSNQKTHRKSFNQRHQGNFPIFVYNLGQRKLIIQNSLGDQATYIYELPCDQFFLNFIEYNEFQDVGFFPNPKQAEMSSNFAFLTESKHSRKMYVNILQVNPYKKCKDGAQPQPTFKVFRSTRYFEAFLFSERDIIVKNIMYHTKKHELDMSYDFKIVFQYRCFFKILKFKMPEDLIDEESDSDALSEGMSTYNSLDYDETRGNLEQVLFALNDQGMIFYVQNKDRSCQIKMMDPRNDEIMKHQNVLELQTKSCRHFSVSYDSFYFIDDQYNIYKFEQNHETFMLKQVDQLQVRDNDKPHLSIKAFDKIIIRDDFLISQSKIFYINASVPYTDGILQMENLEDEENVDNYPRKNQIEQQADATALEKALKRLNHTKHYTDGPFEMRGSEQFIMVYMYGKEKQINQRVYELPDSTSTSLINETNKSVNFSTFININKIPRILVNIGEEYLIFDKDGNFKSLVLFDRMTGNKVRENKAQPSSKLITMSNNGENFLFLNYKTKNLEIYSLMIKQTGLQIQMTDTELDQQESSIDDSMTQTSHLSTPLKQPMSLNQFKMFTGSLNKSFEQALLQPSQSNDQLPSNNQNNLQDKLNQKIRSELVQFKYQKKKQGKELYEFQLQSLINASNIDGDQAKYDSFIDLIDKSEIDCHINHVGRVTFIKAKLNDGFSQDEGCWDGTKLFIDLEISQFDQAESKSYVVVCPEAIQSFNLHEKNLQIKGDFQNAVMKSKELKQTVEKLKEDKEYLNFSQKHEYEEFKDEAKLKKLESVQEELEHSVKSLVKCYKFDWYNNYLPTKKEKRRLNRQISKQKAKKETPKDLKDNSGELLIITCGHQVFFQKFKSHKSANNKGLSKDRKLKLEEMKIDFDKNYEFKSFLETEQALIVQILAEDKQNNIFMIITWDFDKNIEKSMYQVDSKNKPNLQAQVVRGLNQKMNYYVDEDFITDLEYDIPIQKTNPDHSSWYQKQAELNIQNNLNGRERCFMKHLTKIFQDDSRYLCNEHQNVLVFQASRISLKFWSDFASMGSEIQDIKNNFKFEQFQTVLNHQSLFHYFANKQDLFAVIYQQFKEEQNEALYDEKDLNTTPLLMLHPNNDGQTALEMALEARRPKVFQLMLDLLEPFDHRMLTHMMINQLPFIIRNCNQLHLKYLDSAVYQSLTMQIPLVIDWPSDLQEICFPSHTSMITAKEAKRKIKKRVKQDGLYMGYMRQREYCNNNLPTTKSHCGQKLKKINLKNSKDGHLCKSCNQKIGEGSKERYDDYFMFDFQYKLSPQHLHCPTCDDYYCIDCLDEVDNIESEKEATASRLRYLCCLKANNKETPESSDKYRSTTLDFDQKIPTIMKVNVEVLDFNFIFENNNTKAFLMLLAEQKDSDVFVQTSIKVFVDVLWQQFFYLIRFYIFRPYIIYMLSFVMYASEFAGTYQDLQLRAKNRDSNSQDPEYIQETEDLLAKKNNFWKVIVFLTGVNILMGVWFFIVEIQQFRQVLKYKGSGWGYFTDYWNYFDWISLATNMTLVFLVTDNLIRQREHIQTVHIRMIGSFACFFMWFKTFYWMRLFKRTAHFVTLITDTVNKLKVFALMFLLCIFAFANFFYILNNNTSFNKNITREYLQNTHPDNEFYSEENFQEFRYVPEYTSIPVLDSIIYVYLLSLGDLVYDDLNKGDSVKMIFFFFVLATILVYIIFMNVIIAIVSDVFTQVQSKQEESDLKEKIQLIQDFMWLKDLKKYYGEKKYIVRLSADNSTQEKETDFLEELKQLFNHQEQRVDENKQEIMERIGKCEQSTMALLHEQKYRMQENSIFNAQQPVSGEKQNLRHGLLTLLQSDIFSQINAKSIKTVRTSLSQMSPERAKPQKKQTMDEKQGSPLAKPSRRESQYKPNKTNYNTSSKIEEQKSPQERK